MHLDPELTLLLRALVLGRGAGCLATLHDGKPFASMVPFAATTAGGRLRLVVHVSGLATHTRDMRSTPDVCLMMMAPESEAVPPQALPRVSITGRAAFIGTDDPEHGVLAAAYLGKFPEAADLFQFADFSIVAIEPTSARFVAGFARAMTLTRESLTAAVAGEPA
jgi:putative heme iron utilization protein